MFIVHRINNNTKNNKNSDIFHCRTNKDLNNNSPILKLSDNHLNITNSFSSITTNFAEDSRNSLNFFSSELSSPSNLNSSFNLSTNYTDSNKFLGKKKKINIDNIKEDSLNNNYLIQKTDNNINKETINNPLFVINSKYRKKTKKKKEKPSFSNNEGRWTFQEHINFIKALIKYGKNWKEIQKHVGTRTTSQARSHAQKFFYKLKMIKNTDLNIDFTTNNIKNLYDIIQEIKKSNKNNGDDNKFIFDTLIYLDETISRENNDSNKKEKNNKFINNNIKPNFVDNDNIINKQIINEKSIDLENTNLNKEISKIIELKEEKSLSNINDINNKNNNSENEEKNIVENSLNKENEEIINNDYDKVSFENNVNINNNLIFDDDFAYYGNDFKLFNNMSTRIKEYTYNLNFETSFIYNKNYFS